MKLNIYNTTYAPSETGQMAVETEKVLIQSISYNEQGKESARETFDEELNAFGKEVYSYTDQNRLSLEELFDYDQNLVQKIEYQYNEDGKIVSILEQFEDSDDLYITKHKYEGDLLIQIDHYFGNEFDYTEKKFQYDKNLLVKEIEYDEYNDVKVITTFKYNDKGLLIKTVRDEVKDKDRRTYELFYDDQNNKVKELIYNYKDKLIAAQYIRYNDKNQEIEIEWEDLDHYRKTIQAYDGDLLILSEYQDKNGTPTHRTEYFYDDQKNLLLLKRYELEKVYSNALQLVQETFYERVS